MAIELETFIWTDRGVRPSEGDESYAKGEQPVAAYDNWTNWAVTTDLRSIRDEVNSILDRLPSGSGPIEDLWVDRDDPVIDGSLDLNGHDIIDGGRTIYNATNKYIQQSALQNESVEIVAGDYLEGGGSVRLGRSMRIDVNDQLFPRSGGMLTGSVNLNGNSIINGEHISSRNGDGVIYGGVLAGVEQKDTPLDAFGDEFAFLVHNRYEFVQGESNLGRRPAIGFMSSDSNADHVPGAAISYERIGGFSKGEITVEIKSGGNATDPLEPLLTFGDGEIRGRNNAQFTGLRIENRTNRPANAQPGRLIYRSDRD